MAGKVVVTLHGIESSFSLAKVDRARLYGKRKRIAVDSDGSALKRVEVPVVGETVIVPGMTAAAYFDEQGHWVPSSDLVGVDSAGYEVARVPSTLGVAQELELTTPEALAQGQVTGVYHLDAIDFGDALEDALEEGAIFAVNFNYRAGYCPKRAFVVKNDAGVFALVTEPTEIAWQMPDTVVPVTGELDFELDFELL